MMSPVDDDPLPCEEYESALACREQVRAEIEAILAHAGELPAWVVGALKAILEEVL